ncbi:hypothetical protein D3C81_2316150 [compost metagenome]
MRGFAGTRRQLQYFVVQGRIAAKQNYHGTSGSDYDDREEVAWSHGVIKEGPQQVER